MKNVISGLPSSEKDRAEAAAILLAQMAGWEFETHSLMLPLEAKDYLVVTAADLLIVPTVGPMRPQRPKVERIARQTRCDVIMVGVSETKPAHLYCIVGVWSAGCVQWSAGMYWMSRFAKSWIIPDPHDFDPTDHYFPLMPGCIRASSQPDEEALSSPAAGFFRADHVLAVAGIE